MLFRVKPARARRRPGSVMLRSTDSAAVTGLNPKTSHQVVRAARVIESPPVPLRTQFQDRHVQCGGDGFNLLLSWLPVAVNDPNEAVVWDARLTGDLDQAQVSV